LSPKARGVNGESVECEMALFIYVILELKICSTTENVLKTEKILQNPDADSTAVSTNNKN